jgi:hypothetical protein
MAEITSGELVVLAMSPEEADAVAWILEHGMISLGAHWTPPKTHDDPDGERAYGKYETYTYACERILIDLGFPEE